MNTKVTDSIYNVGVIDRNITLFESQYPVEHGMSYNSYCIDDDKIAVIDSVAAGFGDEWLSYIREAIGDKNVDYFIIQHMEPDHSASIDMLLAAYPEAILVVNAKTSSMIDTFFGNHPEWNRKIVKEGDILSLGNRNLTFVMAPMVHWPEVMVTYESTEKILFAADGFGKFGACDYKENWDDEARRYYIGIVGKYGMQVQSLLKKASALDIKTICSLHGPVLTGDLSYYISLYDKWSSYIPESDGIVIAYSSVYGHTREAIELLANKLKEKHIDVVIHDLATTHVSYVVSDCFRYGTIVLATTTYNMSIFPHMHNLINHLVERNFCNKKIALIENGSWAPQAAKIMKDMLSGCKNIEWIDPIISIKSAMNDDNKEQIDELVNSLTR